MPTKGWSTVAVPEEEKERVDRLVTLYNEACRGDEIDSEPYDANHELISDVLDNFENWLETQGVMMKDGVAEEDSASGG